MDTQGAKDYAYQTLAEELPANLTYHNLAHTWEEVIPAARRLATLMGIPPGEIDLLEIAAAFHDIGFTVQYEEHEQAGAEMAGRALPGFGFPPEQVAIVQGLILATHLPQSPHTLLEGILADADLAILGRDNFLERNADLQQELSARGRSFNPGEWTASQIRFMEQHRYFSAAAQTTLEPGKHRNMAELKRRLACRT